MLSRVLKETRSELKEREIPLRAFKVITDPSAGVAVKGTKPAEDSDGLETAEKEAVTILDKARREAEAILEAAEAERVRAIEEGRSAGEERGYREGLERAEKEGEKIRQEADRIRDEARQVLEQSNNLYRETIFQAETAIIEMVEAIATKVLGCEMTKPEVIKEICRQAILKVATGQNYVIYVNPDAAELLYKQRSELLAEAAPGARLQIIADQSLKVGSCRVETENGFIDASLDIQMEEVKKILRGGAHDHGA